MGAGGRRGSFNHTQRHWRSGALPAQHIRACCPAGDLQLEACSVQTTAHAGTKHNSETTHLLCAARSSSRQARMRVLMGSPLRLPTKDSAHRSVPPLVNTQK